MDMPKGRIWCVVPDCRARPWRRGYCGKHYHRLLRHGDPLKITRAISTPGIDREAKRIWIEKYKLEKGCADCGYNAHHVALEFDHLPGSVKVRDIKSGQQLGWAALQAEVAKCEVVCSNCHRIRTFERGREVMKGA